MRMKIVFIETLKVCKYISLSCCYQNIPEQAGKHVLQVLVKINLHQRSSHPDQIERAVNTINTIHFN